MERRKSEKIGDVAQRFLRISGLESPLNEWRLIEAWGEVTGKLVAQRTQDLYISHGVLCVKLRSAVLRAELLLKRSELVQRLNSYVGANVISDIRFA